MDAKEYIVVICGCEGIERIWGLFNKDEALELALQLKNKKDLSSKLKEDLKYDLKYLSPDQVCIMKPNKENEIECCCDEFPELPESEEPWLM